MQIELEYGYSESGSPQIFIGVDIFEDVGGEIFWGFDYFNYSDLISEYEVVDELGGDPGDSVDTAFEKFKSQFTTQDAIEALIENGYEFFNEPHPSLTASERN